MREIVSDEFADIPIIDMKTFIDSSNQKAESLSAGAKEECQKVAECLHKFGILLIRDPRVNMEDNNTYIDMIEDYFEQAGAKFYRGEELSDIRPDCLYQVGVMAEDTEIARNHTEMRNELNLAQADQPVSPMDPVMDAKWRFMWKIGKRPEGAADDFP